MRKQEELIVAFSMCFIALTAGLTVNTYIVFVNFLDWWRGRHLKTTDKIQCSLAISRLIFQCLSFFYIVNYFFAHSLVFDIRFYAREFFEMVSIYSNMWMAALLSVVYFMKVANCQHLLFLRLQRLLSQRVQYFLFGIVLAALCYSCVHTWALRNFLLLYNSTYEKKVIALKRYYTVYLVGNCAAFIVYSFSFALLLVSLCHHMDRMRCQDAGFTSNNLNGYYVAIKAIVSCFILYVLQFVANIFHMMDTPLNIIMWLFVSMSTFISLHSSYLIYGTPKLRQQLSRRCQQGEDH